MKERKRKDCLAGLLLLGAFAVWTLLICSVDLRPAGKTETRVGFAALNRWCHRLTGVHMGLYTVTDWLGLVPIAVCLCFAGLGLTQLIKRKSLFRVDPDILLLGLYDLLVIFCYLVFEMVPINYRPVRINGYLEASYPSSTTLLVLSVMPTLKLEIDRRSGNSVLRGAVTVFVILFSAFMVLGRLIAGVHWVTDIIGSVFLSTGLFRLYRSAIHETDRKGGKPFGRDGHGVS